MRLVTKVDNLRHESHGNPDTFEFLEGYHELSAPLLNVRDVKRYLAMVEGYGYLIVSIAGFEGMDPFLLSLCQSCLVAPSGFLSNALQENSSV